MAGKHKHHNSGTAHALVLLTCSGLGQCPVRYNLAPQALSLLEPWEEVCPLQQAN